jgi:tetrapyrrole methylase family protein/MazG family protein
LRQAPDDESRAAELGDLFFAVVNLARWLKIDAETALREANARFKARFSYIERTARQQERTLSEMSLEELDTLWEQAKKQ